MLIKNLAALFIFYIFLFPYFSPSGKAFSSDIVSTNNVIPFIKNISPNPVVASNSHQTLKITGSGFSAKSQVTLKTEKKTYAIPPSRTKFLNPEHLEIIVNVSTQPSSWTIEVKTPEGSLSKPFQFKVISTSLTKTPEESMEKSEELIKKEAKKIEIEQLKKKSADIKEDIKEKATEVETVKEEAAKALTEKKVAEEKALLIQDQAQQTRGELEAAKKEAAQTNNVKSTIKVEELEKKTELLEKEAQVEKEKFAVTESEVEKAQKKVSESEAAFKRMQEELVRISKERATKRTFLDKSLSAVLVIFAGWVILFLKRYGVKKFEDYITPKETIRESENVLRLKTISELFQWIGTVVVSGIVVFLVLDEFGINMAPLLAGVGVIGLAFGFGGQYLIRDVINGIFILIEGQFHINDVVKLGDFGGVVEAFNLRHTRLRDLEGRVIFIPNGKIEQVINFTRDYSYTLLDIGVAYKENVDRVIEVMKDVGREMQEDLDFGKLILEELDMLGVNCFDDSQVTIRCRIKTFPMKQWGVGREYRRRIKNRFDELGIEIPFPHRTLYWGAASDNDWMKQLVNQKL